jgi:hypothetical protein
MIAHNKSIASVREQDATYWNKSVRLPRLSRVERTQARPLRSQLRPKPGKERPKKTPLTHFEILLVLQRILLGASKVSPQDLKIYSQAFKQKIETLSK